MLQSSSTLHFQNPVTSNQPFLNTYHSRPLTPQCSTPTITREEKYQVNTISTLQSAGTPCAIQKVRDNDFYGEFPSVYSSFKTTAKNKLQKVQPKPPTTSGDFRFEEANSTLAIEISRTIYSPSTDDSVRGVSQAPYTSDELFLALHFVKMK